MQTDIRYLATKFVFVGNNQISLKEMTSITQTSSALYRYLCYHLVGTEQTVKTKRMLITLNDCGSGNSSFTRITSGSFGEGLELKGSDIDQMLLLNFISVHESMDFKPVKDALHFIMDSVGTKPGYTKLKLCKSLTPIYTILNPFEIGSVIIGSDLYLSNIEFKIGFMTGNSDFLCIHGPCLSDKQGTSDVAFCLQSKTWITPANPWLHRPHNEWPCHDVKAKVVDYGVLFVPIGVKGSDNEEFEWRISFSVGEKILIYSFNHTQLLCYALVKILLKDIIESDSRCKSVLCSYYIKTILFWVSEELPLSVWTPENLIPCFLRCFRRLIYCVEYSICPHYFIPENNMFENRINGFFRHVLLENLSMLYSKGWRCLLMSRQISQFQPHIHIRIEFNSFQESVRNIINSNAYNFQGILFSFTARVKHTPLHTMIQFLTQQYHTKSYYAYGVSVASFMEGQSIEFSIDKGNKKTYKHYNTCLSRLLLATHHDAVSGWLLLASFFYKMRQHRITLNILSYFLSKCTPDKIKNGETFADESYQKLSLKTWESIGLLKTIAIMCLMSVNNFRGCQLIPEELDKENNYYSPVVFAHFLRFLCHYHLRDVKQYRNSLRDLHITVTEEYLVHAKRNEILIKSARAAGMETVNVRINSDIITGYYCLGIALQLTKDRESARAAFMKAIKLDFDKTCKFLLRRLSMVDTN